MLVNASLECRCVNRALLDRSTAVKVQGRPECTSERLTSSKCSSPTYSVSEGKLLLAVRKPQMSFTSSTL